MGKFLGFVVLLAAVFIASAVASFAGAGNVIGRDIGFAGAAIPILMAIIGGFSVLAGAVAVYAGGRRLPLAQRHTYFAIGTPAGAYVIGVLLAAITSFHFKPPTSDFVYVQGPVELEFTAPASALVDTPVQVRAMRRAGPWQRVRYTEAQNSGVAYYTEPPARLNAAQPPRGAPYPQLVEQPQDDAHWRNWTAFDESTGMATVVFGRAARFSIWAEQADEHGVVRSNVVNIDVRYREPTVPIHYGVDARGKAFSADAIAAVFRKGRTTTGGEDDAEWRYDLCGAALRFSDYASDSSENGWVIDHIKPLAKGGSNQLSNLQPLQRENARHKSDAYPWTCAPVSPVSGEQTR